MRGLYTIPTRMRQSKWYLLEGDLRIVFSSTENRWLSKLTRPGILEFRLPSGFWRCLLPDSEERGIPKILREVAQAYRGGFAALAGHSHEVTGHARLLLRYVVGAGQETCWDIVVSPNDHLSVSIANAIEQTSGQAEFDRLLNELLQQACPIQWPPWVPHDEALPLEGGDEPSALDQEVWSAIQRAFLEVLPLEEDQIFFTLELSRLEKDSLDDLLLLLKLEEWLGISTDDIDDEQAAEFEKARSVGDVYSMVMQLHAQLRNQRDQA